MKTIVTDISLEIAHNDHAPCPTHEGQWFSKSTGDCSCGSRHHIQDLANARLQAKLCPECGSSNVRFYRVGSNWDPGDSEPAADCYACGWGY